MGHPRARCVPGRLLGMAKRRRERSVPFSDPPHAVPERSDALEVWPQPVRDGVWTDADGTVWRLRHNAGLRRITRLVRSPDVRVLLVYGPDGATAVPPGEREAFWAEVLPHLEGRPGTGDTYTSYVAAEFRAAQRRELVIVEESC